MALTSEDLQNIKNLFQVVLDEDVTLVRKSDIQHLPNKEEYFASQDKLMKELKDIREEIVNLSDMKRQVNNHEIQIQKINEKLQIKPLY